MIQNKLLRIGVRILIILLWCAVALADVIIVDDHVIGFAILIASAGLLYKLERKLCGRTGPKPVKRQEPESTFWLQYADGHCESIADETAKGVVNAVRNFNWDAELAKYARMQGAGVPPGVGLGRMGDKHFVHITATTATGCDVLYVRGQQKPDDHIYRKNQSFNTMAQIVVAYMTGDEAKLMQLLG